MNNGGMSPRDRYYAELRAAEARRAEEARCAEEGRRRQAASEARRRQEEQYRRIKQREEMKRKTRRRAYAGRFVLFIACFAVISVVVAMCVLVSFLLRKPELPSKATYTLVYGDEKVKIAEDKLTRNGVRYADFTKLSEYLSMTFTGGAGKYRFVAGSLGEEASLSDGSDEATVNGQPFRMKGAALVEDGHLWVPFDFIENCVKGVSISENEEKHMITFSVTGALGFTIKGGQPISPIPETGEGTNNETEPPAPPEIEVPTPEFKTDVSEYEKYMNPTGDQRDAYLILVNNWNAVDETHKADDLVDVYYTRKDGRKTQQMRKYAEMALRAFIQEIYANGYDGKGPSGYPVTVMSAYRSFEYQTTLFNSYVDREMKNDKTLTREQAEAKTAVYSARPGTSEHQTGLCVDMHNHSSANDSFAKEEVAGWMEENAWKFGFVLRFPKDKTEITGIKYEPWHFRYVGRYHAYRMTQLGMCLEEYVEYLRNNGELE